MASIKSNFFLISGRISPVSFPFLAFIPTNAGILNNRSRVEDDRFSRGRGGAAGRVFVSMCLGLVRGTG